MNNKNKPKKVGWGFYLIIAIFFLFFIIRIFGYFRETFLEQ